MRLWFQIMKNPLPRTVAAVLFAGAALVGLAVEGCRLLEREPPFRYLSATLVKGEEPGCHSAVGLHYSIRNVGEQYITGVYASFDLYDSEGTQLPNPGGNHFDLSFNGSVAPDSTWTVCTSLDSSFFFLPERELVGERFRIYRVDLADGSAWTDPLGLYFYPYRLTSGGGETVAEAPQ